MSFAEVRFPTTIKVNPIGGAGFSTTVINFPFSGKEQRNKNRSIARMRWTVAIPADDHDAIYTVQTFYRARAGRWQGFRFKDFSDFKSSAPQTALTPLDQTIGTGDGVTKAFQLKKTYTSGAVSQVRTITKPVAGTVRVAVNGSEVVNSGSPAAWTVDTTTGIVTFAVAPTAGHAVQAGFEFDIPVRFDSDEQQISLLDKNLADWPSLDIVEIAL